MPTFGLPCPTLIFTFGLLTWCVRPVPRSVLWIPAAWALLGSTAAIGFGARQDFGLLPAAIIALGFMLWPRKRRMSHAMKIERPFQLGF